MLRTSHLDRQPAIWQSGHIHHPFRTNFFFLHVVRRRQVRLQRTLRKFKCSYTFLWKSTRQLVSLHWCIHTHTLRCLCVRKGQKRQIVVKRTRDDRYMNIDVIVIRTFVHVTFVVIYIQPVGQWLFKPSSGVDVGWFCRPVTSQAVIWCSCWMVLRIFFT